MWRANERFDADPAAPWQELDQVEPSDGRRVLILTADRLCQRLDLDPRRLLGKCHRRLVDALIGVERREQPDHHRTRGPETGARRQIRKSYHVQPTRHAGDAESL